MADDGEAKDLTIWLRRMSQGDPAATEVVAEVVYDELRRIAAFALSAEFRQHSLQPTLLVNEAFLRLIRGQSVDWQDRKHFYALAARMMRRIIIDYFKQKSAQKRPPSALQVPLDGVVVFDDDRRDEVLIVDQALYKLSEFDPRAASIVELRYFAGFSVEEIAGLLNIASRTVRRDWDVAQAWLKQYMSSASSDQREG